MQTTSGQKACIVVGEPTCKATHQLPDRQNSPQLFRLLDCAPLHSFSPTGKRNVARRFNVSEQQLEAALTTYERPGEPTAAEARALDLAGLLAVIAEAVSPAKRTTRPKAAKKGGTKC